MLSPSPPVCCQRGVSVASLRGGRLGSASLSGSLANMSHAAVRKKKKERKKKRSVQTGGGRGGITLLHKGRADSFCVSECQREGKVLRQTGRVKKRRADSSSRHSEHRERD